MTRAPSLLADLLADCDARGIQLTLVGHGGLEIDAPKDALTSRLLARLLARMMAHKSELIAILRSSPAAPTIDLTDANQVWHAALDRRKGDALFPPNGIKGWLAADARGVDFPASSETDEETQSIDPPDACPECGKLELWQTQAGNWRCMRCDPPTKARQLRAQAARLKTEHV